MAQNRFFEDNDKFLNNNREIKEKELGRDTASRQMISLETTSYKKGKNRIQGFSGNIADMERAPPAPRNIDNEINLDEIEAKKSNNRKDKVYKPNPPTLVTDENKQEISIEMKEKQEIERERIANIVKDR